MRKSCSSPWRSFLLWCLALMLPLQGLAAGAGLHCLAMALPAAATASATTSADSGAPHPCHEAAQAAADVSPPAHDDSDPTASQPSCSACAACCVGAALPSQSRWKATATPADTAVIAPPARWAGVTEAGLERPPKHLVV